jgi:glutamate 5-kinase
VEAPGKASNPIRDAGTLVVKVGSSLVTNDGRGLDAEAIARWAGQVAQLTALGKRTILVSSGAIAEGMQRLGWTRRPHSMHELQAAAAVGQMGLVQCYESCFRRHGLRTAQVLLTHADLADRQRYLNARSTLRTLLRLGVIPVINENDTVVTDEIKLGDNDTLGAMVTNLVEADALVILTDQAGLYDADPRMQADAKLIARARAGDPTLESMAGGTGSALAKGGMLTKVLAAKRAARSGAHTVIASGREPDVLVRLDRGAQGLARGPSHGGRPARPGRRCGESAGARRQEPAADRRRRGRGGIPEGRNRRVQRRRGPRSGARAGELLGRGNAPHPAQAFQRDRGDPRLRG